MLAHAYRIPFGFCRIFCFSAVIRWSGIWHGIMSGASSQTNIIICDCLNLKETFNIPCNLWEVNDNYGGRHITTTKATTTNRTKVSTKRRYKNDSFCHLSYFARAYNTHITLYKILFAVFYVCLRIAWSRHHQHRNWIWLHDPCLHLL